MTVDRIGIAVIDGWMHGVMTVDGAVRWSGQQALDGVGANRAEALGRLLRTVPVRRMRRPTVTIALGPRFATVKRLDEMPPTADPAALTAAIASNAGRFFIGGDAGRVVAPVLWKDGAWWAWVVDAALLEDIVEAAAACSTRVGITAAALASLPVDGQTSRVLADGESMVRVSFADGTRDVTPLRRASETEGGTRDEARALAVAAASLDAGMRWDPDAPRRQRVQRRRRRVALATLTALAATVALGAPVIHPVIAGWRAEPASLADVAIATSAETALREHASRLAAMDSLVAFSQSTTPALRLFGDISAHLPEGSAIISYRMDARGVSLVALAPLANTLLPDLGSVEGIRAVQLVGAVTRETIAGRETERIAVVMPFTRDRQLGQASEVAK